MDWPGSPLVPVSPGGPRGPMGPGIPGNPISPLVPTGPGGPIGPCLPGGPSGPGFPGGPGLPRNPGLPRRPALPFGPERRSFSSFAQNWFCSRRSSCLMSSFTWDAVWTDVGCELSGDPRFCLELTFSYRPRPFKNNKDLSEHY